MRPIKFRAWDNVDKRLLYDAEEANHYIGDSIVIECFGQMLHDDRFTIEQDTGMEDYNGMDIYEGDILAWGDETFYHRYQILGVVIYKDGAFMLFDDYRGDDEYVANKIKPLNEVAVKSLKIVGNYRQHAELLEAEK